MGNDSIGPAPTDEAKFQQFPYDFLVAELDQQQQPIQLGAPGGEQLSFSARATSQFPTGAIS